MKKRIRFIFTLLTIILLFQQSLVSAAKPDDQKIGEVLNKQPYADFNMIKNKPVDLVLNAGHYATDVPTLQSKMNSIVKTKLDQHGIPSNIIVKGGTTNIAGKLYAGAQVGISPQGKVYYWGYSSHLGQYWYWTSAYDPDCDCYYNVQQAATAPMQDSGFWSLPLDGTQILNVLVTNDSYSAKYYDNTTGGCYCYRDTTIPYVYFIMKNGSVLRYAGYEGFVDVTNNTIQYSSASGIYPSIRWGDITDYHLIGYFEYITKRDGTAFMAGGTQMATAFNWSAPGTGGSWVQIPVTGKAIKYQDDWYYGCCQTVQILTDQNVAWNIDQSTDYYQNTHSFTINLTQVQTGVNDLWMSSRTGATWLLSNGLFHWNGQTTSIPIVGQPSVPQQAAGGYSINLGIFECK